MGYTMSGFSGFGNSPVKEKFDLTKKEGLGPRAEKIEDKDGDKEEEVEPGASVTLDPGYEDALKIQGTQIEGVVPGSQTFIQRKNK